MKLRRDSAVSFVLKYGPNFNNIQKCCIITEIYSICLVVTASQFVLHIVAIEIFAIRWVITIQKVLLS